MMGQTYRQLLMNANKKPHIKLTLYDFKTHKKLTFLFGITYLSAT